MSNENAICVRLQRIIAVAEFERENHCFRDLT